MVAASQPHAMRAGLRMLERGGNAMDAAIAATAMLCVTEPMSTGIGGDVSRSSGRRRGAIGARRCRPGARPASTPPSGSAERGPRSVDVPGAVAGWARARRALRPARARHLPGRRDRRRRAGLRARLRAPPRSWARGRARPRRARCRRPGRGDRALPGARRDAPRHRRRRRRRALPRPASQRRSPRRAGWTSRISPATSRAGSSRSAPFGGVEVLELPPPTQGVAALEALGLLERLEPTLAEPGAPRAPRARGRLRPRARRRRRRASCSSPSTSAPRAATRAARDGARGRNGLPLRRRRGPHGGLAHPEPVQGFGSGVLAPGTGSSLNNRAACFAVNGHVEAGRRPYHTIIPGMLLGAGGALVGPFGVMGGFIQAQAHVQFVVGAGAGGSLIRRRHSTGRGSACRTVRSGSSRAYGSTPTLAAAARPRSRPQHRDVGIRRRTGDLPPRRRPGRRLRRAQGRLRGAGCSHFPATSPA